MGISFLFSSNSMSQVLMAPAPSNGKYLSSWKFSSNIPLFIYPDFATGPFGTFPWILIPTVAVPISIALHGIVLYRVWKSKAMIKSNRYV
ncbi:MAG: hypothetical protein WA941_19000 [Nitrososphaeraceae archaeon]